MDFEPAPYLKVSLSYFLFFPTMVLHIVAMQCYLSYSSKIWWFLGFKSCTPSKVIITYWLCLLSCAVQYILVAYFIPKTFHLLCGFDPWVRKISWRREWQPNPVLLPRESHGQRSLEGYSLWGPKESDWKTNTHIRNIFLQYLKLCHRNDTRDLSSVTLLLRVCEGSGRWHFLAIKHLKIKVCVLFLDMLIAVFIACSMMQMLHLYALALLSFLDSTLITKYFSFCVWRISLSIMASKSIHVASDGRRSVCLWLKSILLYVYCYVYIYIYIWHLP